MDNSNQKLWESAKTQYASQIMRSLWEHGAFSIRETKLKSMRLSPYYINLRGIGSHKDGKDVLNLIGNGLSEMIQNEIGAVDKVVGVAYGGIPLAISVTMTSGIPSGFTRKEAKQYGIRGSFVEGLLADNDRVVLVDDLITTGDSKTEAMESLRNQASMDRVNVTVLGVACVFDREEGGAKTLESEGIKVFPLIRVSWAVNFLFEEDLISLEEKEKILKYIGEHQIA